MMDTVETLVRLEQAQEAERLARSEVLPHLEREQDHLAAAVVLSRIADAYRHRKEHSKALEILLTEALPQAMQLEDPEAKAEVLSRVVMSQLGSGNLELAQRIIDDSAFPLERWLDPPTQALMGLRLAEAQREHGETERAIQTVLLRVLPYCQSDARMEALAWHALARAHRDRGELQEQIRVLRAKALPIYKRLGNASGRALAQMSIAEAMVNLGHHDEALLLLRKEKKALLVSDATSRKDALDKLNILLQLATSFAQLGERGEAQDLLRTAMSQTLVPALQSELQRAIENLKEPLSAEDRGIEQRIHTCAGPEVYEDQRAEPTPSDL